MIAPLILIVGFLVWLHPEIMMPIAVIVMFFYFLQFLFIKKHVV